MTEVRKSLALSTLESYFGSGLQIISTIVVARLLTPSDMGVFAVAAVFVALGHMFRDFGIGEYLIQERELNDERIRAALSVNVIVSWFIALILFFGSTYVADFYRTPGVVDVLRVQAMNFVLVPFGAIAMAWFRREMNFTPVLVAGILASIVQFVVTVVLAVRGFGYMSFAWASFAATVATVTTSVIMRPRGFPRWPGVHGLGRVFNFGRQAIGIYLFGQLGKGMPELVIGRAIDMAAVGFYSRAQGIGDILNRLVLKAVMPVYLPYFASAVRVSGSPLRELQTSMAYLTVVGWPFLALAGLAAESVLRIIYGPQWTPAAPLAKILCLVAAIEIIYYSAKEALLSVGRVREANRLQLITQVVRIVGAILGIPFGLNGICLGLLGATIVTTVITYFCLKSVLNLDLRQTLDALLPSLRVTVLASVPILAAVLLIPRGPYAHLLTVVGGGAIAAIVWFLAIKSLRHPIWPEVKEIAGTVVRRLRIHR